MAPRRKPLALPCLLLASITAAACARLPAHDWKQQHALWQMLRAHNAAGPDDEGSLDLEVGAGDGPVTF